jgi:nucleoside phosphorylase
VQGASATAKRAGASAAAGLAALCALATVGCAWGGFGEQGDGPARPVDIAIITILPEEYGAVLRQLSRVVPDPGSASFPNRYAWALGEVESAFDRPYRVVVALAGEAGEISGAVVTLTTIIRWRPRYVLLVGIAGGIPGAVKLGDVVVASAIWGYEYGHLTDRFVPRRQLTFWSDPVLVRGAEKLGAGWRPDIRATAPPADVEPRVVVGHVASGDKVIETSTSGLFAAIRKAGPEFISLEMEGAGAAAAVEEAQDLGIAVGFLMIRGISDVVQSNADLRRSTAPSGPNLQRGTWKQYAADAAAGFAVDLIRSDWPEAPR